MTDDVLPDAEEEVAGEQQDRLGGELGDRDHRRADESVPGGQRQVQWHLAKDDPGEVLFVGGAAH